MKNLVELYIDSSVHVALSVCFLTYVASVKMGWSSDHSLYGYIFCVTNLGYNYTKHIKFDRGLRELIRGSFRGQFILVLSAIVLFGTFYFGSQMSASVLLLSILIAIVTLSYKLPLLKNKHGLRQLPYIKIYMIALCWGITTVLLPDLYDDNLIINQSWLLMAHNVLFVIAITIPFDIRDLEYDSEYLGTIPQLVGVRRSKILSVVLLGACLMIESYLYGQMSYDAIVVILLTAGTVYTMPSKVPKYYCELGIEGIPIIWGLILLMGV